MGRNFFPHRRKQPLRVEGRAVFVRLTREDFCYLFSFLFFSFCMVTSGTYRQWLWDFDIMQGIYLINHVHNARYLFVRMNLFSVCKCTCP